MTFFWFKYAVSTRLEGDGKDLLILVHCIGLCRLLNILKVCILGLNTDRKQSIEDRKYGHYIILYLAFTFENLQLSASLVFQLKLIHFCVCIFFSVSQTWIKAYIHILLYSTFRSKHWLCTKNQRYEILFSFFLFYFFNFLFTSRGICNVKTHTIQKQNKTKPTNKQPPSPPPKKKNKYKKNVFVFCLNLL